MTDQFHGDFLTPEANRTSAPQKFALLLWNPKVYYRVHNSPPVYPTLDDITEVHILPRYIFTTDLRLSAQITLISRKRSVRFRFPDQKFSHTHCDRIVPVTCHFHILDLDSFTIKMFVTNICNVCRRTQQTCYFRHNYSTA